MQKNIPYLVLVLTVFGCTGCLKNLEKPDDLSSHFDETHNFTVTQPFDVVYAAVESGTQHCWSMTSNGQLMATGSGFVHAGSGIKREVEERVLESGRHGSVAVVIHAYWPLPPVSYILRADVVALGTNETKVTTYNSDGNKAQRSFHRQVRSWVDGNTSDCAGMGMFD